MGKHIQLKHLLWILPFSIFLILLVWHQIFELLLPGAGPLLKGILNGLVVSGVAFLITYKAINYHLNMTKAASESIHHAYNRYHSLVKESAEGILVVDEQTGAILESNPKMESICGRCQEDLEGTQAAELFGKEDWAELKRELLEGRAPGAHYMTLRTPEGKEAEVRVSSSRIRLPSGEAIQMIITDVTEEKRIQKLSASLRQILDKLHARLDEEELLATASRELKELGIYFCKYKFSPGSGEVILEYSSCNYMEDTEAGYICPSLNTLYGQPIPADQVPILKEFLGSGKPKLITLPGPDGAPSLRAVPALFYHEGRPEGILILEAPWFKESDLPLLSAFATQLGLALENARLFCDIERSRGKLAKEVSQYHLLVELLMELNRQLIHIRNYTDIHKQVLSFASVVTPTVFSILAFNVPGENVIYKARYPARPVGEEFISEAEEIFNQELARLNPLLPGLHTEEAETHPEISGTPIEGGLSEYLHSPIYLEGQPIGLLGLYNDKPGVFTHEHRWMLNLIAYITSLSVERLNFLRVREHNLLVSSIWSLPDGILLLDETGLLLAFNRKGQEYLSTISGRSYALGEKLDLNMPALSNCRFVLTGEKSQSFEEHEVEGRRFSIRCLPVPQEDGSSLKFMLILRDITEERRAQEQLFFASKLASIGELAAGIAHEVNNPLQAIIGFSELLLQRNDLSEKAKQQVTHILEAGKRAAEIVRNLLSFARRQRRMEEVPADPNQLIEEALFLVKRQYAKDNVELIIEQDPSIGTVLLNAAAIQQIVLNLVQNARDAIVSTGRPGKVVVRLEKWSQDEIAISVEDNGPGIPKEIESRIFEPFFSTKEKGTGLGLSVIYRLVSEMGGWIMLDNRPGEGVKFTITLPVRKEINKESPSTPNLIG